MTMKSTGKSDIVSVLVHHKICHSNQIGEERVFGRVLKPRSNGCDLVNVVNVVVFEIKEGDLYEQTYKLTSLPGLDMLTITES